jgi:hypothetical protein
VRFVRQQPALCEAVRQPVEADGDRAPAAGRSTEHHLSELRDAAGRDDDVGHGHTAELLRLLGANPHRTPVSNGARASSATVYS